MMVLVGYICQSTLFQLLIDFCGILELFWYPFLRMCIVGAISGYCVIGMQESATTYEEGSG